MTRKLPKDTDDEVRELQKRIEKQVKELEALQQQQDNQPQTPPQQIPTGTQEPIQIEEVEINLSLLNNKINHIISKLEELHK